MRLSLILILNAIVVLIIAIVVRNIQSRKVKEVLSKIDKKRVLAINSNANFFGQQSLGLTQMKGNGVLILMDSEVYYEMWIPKKIIRIPLESIKDIEETKFYLGKTKFKPLLKITFINDENEEDSCTWLVSNIKGWKEKLKIQANK